MISDSTYFLMMNDALAATSGLSKNSSALVLNGSTLGLPITLPTSNILLNGNPSMNNIINPQVSNIFSSNSTNSIADSDRPFTCEVCGNKYKSKPGLNYHRIHGHQDPTKFHLNSALVNSFNGQLNSKNLLSVNSAEATEATIAAVVAASSTSSSFLNQFTSYRPYSCKVCGAKYKSKPGLNYHRLRVHLEKPKNQASVADNSYIDLLKAQASTSSGLSDSVSASAALSSEADRPHICEVCGAKYKSKPGLAYHRIRTHQDEKPQPFVCSVCGANYKSKPGLAYHRIHAHPGVNASSSA